MRDVMDFTMPARPPEHEIEIEIASIVVADRLRLVDRAHVEAIAASVNETYLHQPIAVSTIPGSNSVELVDGETRLEAFKLLGRTVIPARIREMTADERRKHEIHANLIRNELTILDRNVFIGKLAEIHEAENAEARNGGDRKSKKWRQKNQFANLANWSAFSKEASRRTGLSVRSIERARELSAKLSPEAIKLLHGSKLASNQAQLQALAALEPADQVTVAGLIGAKAASTVAKARVIAGFVPAGGAVRAAETQLMKLEPIVARALSGRGPGALRHVRRPYRGVDARQGQEGRCGMSGSTYIQQQRDLARSALRQVTPGALLAIRQKFVDGVYGAVHSDAIHAASVNDVLQPSSIDGTVGNIGDQQAHKRLDDQVASEGLAERVQLSIDVGRAPDHCGTLPDSLDCVTHEERR